MNRYEESGLEQLTSLVFVHTIIQLTSLHCIQSLVNELSNPSWRRTAQRKSEAGLARAGRRREAGGPEPRRFLVENGGSCHSGLAPAEVTGSCRLAICGNGGFEADAGRLAGGGRATAELGSSSRRAPWRRINMNHDGGSSVTETSRRRRLRGGEAPRRLGREAESTAAVQPRQKPLRQPGRLATAKASARST